MPVMHHPYPPSWGYQVSGYFAPLSTLGTPDDFRALVDAFHARRHRRDPRLGAGALPARRVGARALRRHGAVRARGPAPRLPSRLGHARSSTSARHEVRNFLLANALYWVREFHADGLRVDAVASMLYLDYSRKPGEWVPNKFGGRENLEAVGFLRELNEVLHAREPGVAVIAEESTAWPGVSRPTSLGGLGFAFKWNMGWMHDTLEYLENEPMHRRFHHDELTFSLVYAWNENFVLPLSHDEVVHGKRSLSRKLPGDRWQQLATLRALYGYMWAHPGKQLALHGRRAGRGERMVRAALARLAPARLSGPRGRRALVRDLNRVYRAQPALWEVDFRPEGFALARRRRRDENVLAFARVRGRRAQPLVCVVNLSPVVREHWRLPLPVAGRWREVLNTDSRFYGGSDVGNGLGIVATEPVPLYGQQYSAQVTLPPLATVWLVPATARSRRTVLDRRCGRVRRRAARASSAPPRPQAGIRRPAGGERGHAARAGRACAGRARRTVSST